MVFISICYFLKVSYFTACSFSTKWFYNWVQITIVKSLFCQTQIGQNQLCDFFFYIRYFSMQLKILTDVLTGSVYWRASWEAIFIIRSSLWCLTQIWCPCPGCHQKRERRRSRGQRVNVSPPARALRLAWRGQEWTHARVEASTDLLICWRGFHVSAPNEGMKDFVVSSCVSTL